MTFQSEDARRAALVGLPDTPPPGTTDVQEWVRGVERQKEQILTAEIVAAPQAPETPPTSQTPGSQGQPAVPTADYKVAPATPEPAPAPAPSATQTPTVEEDELTFSLKRSELPEELRKYRTPGDIVKQFAHARRYANKTEETVGELAKEKERLQRELAELKSRQVAPPPSQPAVPVPPPSPRDKRYIAQVRENLKALPREMNDLVEHPEQLATITSTIEATAQALENIDSAFDGEVASLRRQLEEQSQELKRVATTNDAVRQDIQAKEQIRTVAKRVGEFQSSKEELKTTKPVFGIEGETVEQDAWRFADAIAMRKDHRHVSSWDEVNRLVNAYLRNDPETVAYCQSNGLSPEQLGSSAKDLQTYAICLNVDKMKHGYRVDEYTGQTVPATDFMGKPINFPDHESAYEYLLRTSGIAQRRREEELRQAEIQGQTKLEGALHRTPVPTMGREGATPRPTQSKSMTVEDAARLLDKFDVYKMHTAAMAGDRSLFNLYQKCQETIGVPGSQLAKPDPRWPAEKMAA